MKLFAESLYVHKNLLDDFKIEDVTGNNDFSNNYTGFNANGTTTLSLSSGRLKATGASYAERVKCNVPTVVGKTYEASVDLDLSSGGTLAFVARNTATSANIEVAVANSNGTYTIRFVAENSVTEIRVQNNQGSGTRDFYLDNFSVEEITTTGFLADIRQSTDYSPFGVQLDGRNLSLAGSSSSHRYGFQGQEKDDELSGDGNSYSAEFWQYDSRLGRRWNLDPIIKEHESPYAAFANNPIWFIDPNGADTIDGNKAIPAIKDLDEWEASLEKIRENILEMIANRDQIRKQIDDADEMHDWASLLTDISPFRSPGSKAVKKHVEINDKAIKLLKASFVVMEIIINNEISKYNEEVNAYNNELLKLQGDFIGMDDDDNLYISNQEGTVFLPQNKTNKKALLRVTIDDEVYRFGIVSNETKSKIVTLNSQEGMETISYSLDLLGVSAEALIKNNPMFKKYYSKLTKDIRKGLAKELKRL